MFYVLIRQFFRVVLKVLRRWEVHGLANLPPQGGLVVVSNHASYWDPIIVGCALTRRVNYLAKEELFRIPIFRNIITGMAAFPVKRNQADRAAIRKALDYLAQGQLVGVFPEGTRRGAKQDLAPQLGAAMLAGKGGVPMLPIGIIGSPGVFRKVKVNIGPPVDFNTAQKATRKDLETASILIMNRVNHLLDENKK
jgi:1-acyl-sn-glycerol-3-phosphate acyltransferase